MSAFHQLTPHAYLLHDPVHVVLIGHAGQLQVDGEIFTDVGYGSDGLRRGRTVGVSAMSSFHETVGGL